MTVQRDLAFGRYSLSSGVVFVNSGAFLSVLFCGVGLF